MSPKLVLQLWRQRWDKADEGVARKPYVAGKVYEKLKRVPYSRGWEARGVSWLVILCSVVFLVAVCHINFSLNGQITFAGLVVLFAMYLRRFKGPLMTLLLVCLSLMCTMQYLTWRLGQTIVDQSGNAFGWAFLLGSIEVCVAFYFFLGWVIHIWQVEQKTVTIDLEEDDYPTVDVILLCSKVSEKFASEHIKAIETLKWPKKKLKIFVCDSELRESLREITEKQKLVRCAKLPEAISLGNGELIATIDLAKEESPLPENDFLIRTVGWFVRDQGLAFLYDAKHFLGLKPCKRIEEKYQLGSQGRSIIRRKELNLRSPLSNEALQLRLKTRSALLVDTGAQHHYLRIDRADSNRIHWSKEKLVDLQRVLFFYKPFVLLTLYTVPLANLVGGVNLLQAPPQWWLAMALPYIILIAITQARCTNPNRLGTWKEMTELALSAYLLIPTSFYFLRTKLANPVVAISKFGADQNLYSFTKDTAIYILFWANVAAFSCGIWGLIFGGFLAELAATLFGDEVTALNKTMVSERHSWQMLYCVWALVNASLLLAIKAIDHEASEVRHFARNQNKLSGAIRLPFGRLLVCETVNFPSHDLELKMPLSKDLQKNIETQLLINHQNRSYTVLVKVTDIEEGMTRVSVVLNEATKSDFEALQHAVFARGPNWPLWLPHQHADKPLPAWLYRLMEVVPVKVLDLMTNLTSFLRWDAFMQLWKK
jgi:cellulose synthase (UDP-forming)